MYRIKFAQDTKFFVGALCISIFFCSTGVVAVLHSLFAMFPNVVVHENRKYRGAQSITLSVRLPSTGSPMQQRATLELIADHHINAHRRADEFQRWEEEDQLERKRERELKSTTGRSRPRWKKNMLGNPEYVKRARDMPRWKKNILSNPECAKQARDKSL